MPLYIDIHKAPDASAEDLKEAHLADIAIQDQFGVTSRTYWLNKSNGTVNCLMEAPNPEQANAMHEASHGLLAVKMIEVSEDIVESFLGKIELTPAAIDPGTTNTGSALRIILFTDIVGSTKMTQELGDTAAMDILRIHDAIVRGALEKHGGREVKHTGDGIMACFASVAGSINSAIHMQRALKEYNQNNPDINLQVRIGLSAGEPVEENQDLFGTAVQLAARICDLAESRGILTSNTVRALCAGKGIKFGEPFDVLLKGFTESTVLNSIIW